MFFSVNWISQYRCIFRCILDQEQERFTSGQPCGIEKKYGKNICSIFAHSLIGEFLVLGQLPPRLVWEKSGQARVAAYRVKLAWVKLVDLITTSMDPKVAVHFSKKASKKNHSSKMFQDIWIKNGWSNNVSFQGIFPGKSSRCSLNTNHLR